MKRGAGWKGCLVARFANLEERSVINAVILHDIDIHSKVFSNRDKGFNNPKEHAGDYGHDIRRYGKDTRHYLTR